MNANKNNMRIEVVQPEISSEIQQATLEELKNWIRDGKLQPAHKVRLQNLTWMEAQNIPAFQALFESKKNNHSTLQSNHFQNQPSSEVYTPEKSQSEKFEESASAQSKSVEPKKKSTQTLPKSAKKPLDVKKTINFLGRCAVVALISLVVSYLWVYQLKSPAPVDEKSLPELSKLKDKLASDKANLSLKEPAEVSMETAKLDKQFNAKRKIIVENNRSSLASSSFQRTFIFIFTVLMFVFLLSKLLNSDFARPVENQLLSKSTG